MVRVDELAMAVAAAVGGIEGDAYLGEGRREWCGRAWMVGKALRLVVGHGWWLGGSGGSGIFSR